MFKRAKVLYYYDGRMSISHSFFLDLAKKAFANLSLPPIDKKVLDISNLENFYNNLPPGTVFAYTYEISQPKIIFCFPLHSLHFSLPVKPGEFVWYFSNNETFSSESIFDSIQNYWVSKICGSALSEDVNYSILERDYLIIDENLNKENVSYNQSTFSGIQEDNSDRNLKENFMNIPDYGKNENFSTLYPDVFSSSDVFSLNNSDSFSIRPIPRYFSKKHEVSIQGSNNSLLNLTNEKEFGSIDLVSGRLGLIDYKDEVKESERFVISNVKSGLNGILNPDDTIIYGRNYNIITNTNGEKELFKGTKYYFGSAGFNYNNNNKETEIDYDYDSSRIKITESGFDPNIAFNNITMMFSTVLKKEDFSPLTDEITSKDFNISEISSFNDLNNNSNDDDSESYIPFYPPSILIKSTDVVIAAREELIDSEDRAIDAGSITIVKSSLDPINESSINLDRKGNIHLSGKNISIGNFINELVVKDLINYDDIFTSEEDVIDNIPKEKIDELCGKGESVIIGYDKKHSEPLVLGNSLVTVLKDLIEVNISLLDEVEKLSNALQIHTHIGIPISGISGPPQDISPYIEYSNTGKSEINSDLEEIRGNLKLILSRFAKTS